MKKLIAIVCGLLCFTAFAAEVIPPVPAKYFNDYASVVSAGTGAQLNQKLEQFERDTSSQIVVAVYPKMQSDSSIEDYTRRVAQSWKVGQADKKSGAVLFVFIQDRKMFLQTGYGLEGALPDAICKRIIEDEIKPQFRAGNYDAGLTAGVNAILAAAKGEYKGTGLTVAESHSGMGHNNPAVPIIFVFFLIFVVIALARAGRRGYYYNGSGWRGSSWSGGWSSGGWNSGGGGGWSGGGGFSGGGGGFSAGGGSFGGGGAGGSW